MSTTNVSTSNPYVSVIIPVFNDPEGLRTTVESLSGQTYPEKRFEILIVDNNSMDNTHSVADKFAKNNDNIAVLVEDEVQSSYAARNKGIRHAEGEILAFVDADISLDEDWLESAIHSMISNEAEYFATDVEVLKEDDNFFAKYSYQTGFQIGPYIEHWHFAPTCCLFVTRTLIEDVGLFDQRIVSGGDSEFGNRVYNAGYELYFDDSIVVYHPARSSFKSLVNKATRLGRGMAQQKRYYPDRYRSLLDPRNFLPAHPLRFYQRLNHPEEVHSIEILGFYFLSYILKLIKNVGRVGEIIRYRVGASKL